MAPYTRPSFEPKTVEEFIQWRRDHSALIENDRKERYLETLVREKRFIEYIKSKFALSFSATDAVMQGYIETLCAQIQEFNNASSQNKALMVVESSPIKKSPVHRKISTDRKTAATPEKNSNYIEIDPTRLRFPRFSPQPQKTSAENE